MLLSWNIIFRFLHSFILIHLYLFKMEKCPIESYKILIHLHPKLYSNLMNLAIRTKCLNKINFLLKI